MATQQETIGHFCAAGKTIMYMHMLVFCLSNYNASPTKWQQYTDNKQTIQY